MEIYLVGGAVRDKQLGLAVQDRDYVVVGATPEEMTARGFKMVGADFTVFLHPETREEYALARTELKSGRGYKGFTVYAGPDVTLEDDLARRDLTINAMGERADGVLIDPFGGIEDLRRGILRHVSPAFVEDPLWVLRVARFALPDDIPVMPGPSRLGQFIEYMSKHSRIQIVDLRQDLIEASQKKPVYYKTDIHWTYLGNYIAYSKVMDALSPTFPGLQPHRRRDYQLYFLCQNTMPLANVAGLPFIKEKSWQLAPKFSYNVHTAQFPIPPDLWG